MAKPTGRVWATAAFSVGISASVACNVAHTFTHKHPSPGAVVMAAFWPVALLLSIEVIARVDWPGGRWWALVRYGGLVAVAAIAAIISYRHMSGLLTYYGEDALGATIGPLAVDGLMAVSTAALLALGRHRPAEEPVEALEAAPMAQEVAADPVAALELPAPRQVGVPRSRRADQAKRDRARQSYVESVAAGAPLTGTELGKRYKRSRQWADAIIREAKTAA